MKRLSLSFVCSMALFAASSQKIYFIYLQAETEQPFFVKMNEGVYSSAASGYLILAKLHDSTYNFSIGFPQNKWPEQSFSVTVNKKDHGYLIKNFNEKGWGLFDLQTLSVQMFLAVAAKTGAEKNNENKDVSAFTDILSKAADDPSLKEKPARPPIEEKKPEVISANGVKKEEPKAEIKEQTITKPVEIVEQSAVKKQEPNTEVKDEAGAKPVETVEQPVVKKQEAKTEVKDEPGAKPVETVEQPIVKKQEAKTEVKDEPGTKPVETVEQPVVKKQQPKTEVKDEPGAKPVEIVEQLVVKKDNLKTETKEKPLTQTGEVEMVSAYSYKRSQVIKKSESSTTEGFGLVFIDQYENATNDTIRLLIPNLKPVISPVIKEQPKEEKIFLEISMDTIKKAEEKSAEIKPPVREEPVANAAIKNNCAEVATEVDFFKLRKKMAAVESDDDMIAEAKKYFKTKCFATSQLKNLGTLFLTDGGRYKFFDAAYSYAADAENFISLQAELKDEYYINRFKAMLRN